VYRLRYDQFLFVPCVPGFQPGNPLSGPKQYRVATRRCRFHQSPPVLPFKYLVGRIAEEDVPFAEATPVAASLPITSDNNEERLLRLEAQLALERQRVENLQLQQQQQQRERPPSSTTGSAAPCSFSSKQKLWIALGIVLVAVVVVVVIDMIAGGPDTPVPVVPSSVAPATKSPVPPPPPTRDESIISYIKSITLSNQTLSYPPRTPGRSAEERAIQWLIEDDLNTAADDLDALRQRYVLSTLWFIPTPAGFGTGSGVFDNYADTWTTNLDECAWLYVDCDDDGRVTGFSLQNVQGRIPDDLGLLTAMTSLGVSLNKLTGTIPSSLAAMTDLVRLDFKSNELTGTIPSSLSAMTNLVNLGLDYNLLSGIIPSSLAAMTDLVNLGLRNNTLTGTIPSSLGTLKALTSLELSNNQLTGTIPSSLVAIRGLTTFSVSTNQLTGTIPLSLGETTALIDLRLFNNQLNGTLSSCGLNQTSKRWVADCAEVICPCCTQCCPTASVDGTIPVYDSCS
jgi:Leucine rich repeat